MEDPKHYPRLTWVAVALSLVATGVGHIYCGQIVKGILMFSAWFLVAPLVLVATAVPPTTSTLIWLFVAPVLFLLALHVLLDGLDGPLARHLGVDSPKGSRDRGSS